MRANQILCGPALILVGMVLTAGNADAQPLSRTLWSIEARVAQAENVVVGTIEKVTRTVIVAPGKPDKSGSIYPDGQFDYTMTLKVSETLKGELKATVDDLRAVHSIGGDDRYEQWCQAQTAQLWFLGPTPKAGERREWFALPLGKRVPAEDLYGPRPEPPSLAMDLSSLPNDETLLARARSFARTNKKVLPVHTIRIPAVISRGMGALDSLIMPVEPTLEDRARRLIAAPRDFVPKGQKLDPSGRYMLRYGGVDLLRYFKSDANAALLRSLLDEPADEFQDWIAPHHPVRVKAYEVLLHWGVETPLPKSPEEITSLNLANTDVTDIALKQLGPLKNLDSLDLRDTKVTDRGLKELAGLTKLTRLGLSEGQMSDANLHVLREIGLLHALSQANAEGQNRPKSAEDISALALCRGPVTDAGLRELSALKNLAWLDLRDTRVTDAGLKELASLKNLGTLLLQNTRVTDAGVAELQKALPNCTIRTGAE